MDVLTAEWYDNHAADYARQTNSFDYFMGLEADLRRFVGQLRDDSIVLDLGSGAGRDARFIAEHGHTAVAIDVSKQLLRECVVHAGRSEKVVPVNCDFRDLPVADASVDGIWACGSLLHLVRDDILPVLKRCYRILKLNSPVGLSMKFGTGDERRPDGRLFTYVGHEELKELLVNAGFQKISMSGPARRNWLLATAYKV